ncbi:MAG TPA: GNAT family N-acetyltransferase [Acetobacteraceae bacterium]|jgi:predicted acetyltransferase|nr:GNAT family N-acetyltransferase [Acetobacteraceae bacterium]
MHLRRARPDESDEIADLHRVVRQTCLPFLPDQHTPDQVRTFFRDRVFPSSEVWVADDGVIRGFVAFRPDWVDHLYVANEAQRRGIGSALLALATERHRALSLWAFQRNAPAQRFYLARGWRPVEHTDGSGNMEREPDTRFVWRKAAPERLQLVAPSRSLLPDYVSALLARWSPNSDRDTCGAEIATIAADADAHLEALNGGEGTIELPDGRLVPRLPGRVFWLWDGGFCGNIGLRYAPGTEDLPAHVSGHIGYNVVPWKQRRGYATRALAMILPHAREIGLSRVLVTCSEDNTASRKVIEANGGVFAGTAPNPHRTGTDRLLYWVATTGT